ncbi:replication protein A 70 kDa DNA-binding subunit B-like [Silene latifolia]|uniref:replication protein A 70 kDa DNA-binding subunit B-like n=1 Tax=Silene latifolia TaxID=37657 RepID=UPI003D77CC03
MYNGQYEIANAPIKPCDEKWRVSASDLNYQMQFGKPAIVEPVDSSQGIIMPEYRNIAQIPKTADPNDKYDIVSVVLFVEAEARRILRDEGRVICVREIMIIDHSTEQPLLISAWNDLAKDECDLLIQKAEQLQVVGFTALKVSPHRGFSMTTTMSTTIVHSADGDKSRALEDWAANHKTKLCHIEAQILTLKGLMGNQQSITIAALRMKKAHTTLQDEKYTLQVTIPEPDFQKINAYLGCSSCNKRTDTPVGKSMTCPQCSKPGTKSVPRVTFNCKVSDGTGILPITAFTTDSEKIFNMPASNIFRMKHSVHLSTLFSQFSYHI